MSSNASAQRSEAVIRVVVDRPLRSPLDYWLPAGHERQHWLVGTRVHVPIGRGHAIGLIIEQADASSLPPEKLKQASECLDTEPLFNAELLDLLQWTAAYYHHPIGEVVFSALPRALRQGASAQAVHEHVRISAAGLQALQAGEPRRAARQRELLNLLARARDAISCDDLSALQPNWRPVAQVMRARGWLQFEQQTMVPAGSVAENAGSESGPALTAEQAEAVFAIDTQPPTFTPFLLQGATGSGKTEVYLRAVATVLARNDNALVLVPEIALTPQLVGRFRARFAVPLAVLHSGMTDTERLAAWRMAQAGVARIIIGTRSAVFAPLPRLGLIIVDEEHDSSYKQQEGGCRYSARDLAVRRAQQARVPVVLGSATPSLETLHNVATGRYQRLLLPRRADQAGTARIALIDLRSQAMHTGISTAVTQAMQRHLEQAGQVLVFINRRGYAPTLLCTACGWIAPCHSCDARMTVHHAAGRLRCHICGADEALPARCPRCGFDVKPVGQGTERVEEALAALFPQHPLVRLDRDTARTAGDVEAVMQAVLDGHARILVGTQMVTKGHHFPDVTLVVVLNADQGLFSTDFRASERLAQTIVQVAGRAGRATRPGEVLLQTEYPEHPLLQSLLAGGYEAFATAALAERAQAQWPPFGRMTLLRASARNAAHATDFLVAARRAAGRPEGVRLLGPVNAAMARRAGRHHAQLLLESTGRGELHRFLDAWLPRIEQLPAARRVRWALDVDPLETQ